MKWVGFFLILSLHLQALEDTYTRNKAYNEAVEQLINNPSNSFENNTLMGNNLVQLRQYPLALFYYLKAMDKDPSNQEIKNLIQETIKLGSLPAQLPEPKLFGPPLWLQVFTFLGLFLALSYWIATKNKLALGVAGLLALLFLTLLMMTYRTPILAVTIRAQELYQAPSEEASVVSPAALPAGLIITVLNVEQEGSWIKIRTPENVMGYLPEKALRMID